VRSTIRSRPSPLPVQSSSTGGRGRDYVRLRLRTCPVHGGIGGVAACTKSGHHPIATQGGGSSRMVEGGHHHNPEEQQELRIRRWRGTHAQQGGHPMNLVDDPESSCAGQCVGVGARRGGRTLLTTCHTGAAGKETACRGGPALHAIQLASAWSRASQQMHAHPDNSGTACRDSGTALDTSNTPLAESVPHSAQPQASSQFSEAVEA
jgi:hypothetical protein